MADSFNRELLYVFTLLVVVLEFGMIFSFGAVFVALLKEYGEDRSTTATIQSILIGVTLSFGVISGALITRLGLPVVTLMSSVLVPVGFSLSFFATKIEHLYISIGVVSGIGISMGYVSSIVVVGRIFSGQKRIVYLSIQTSFIGLSGLVYPYIFDWLIGKYGLKGTFLILGAVYSNTFPFFILCLLHRQSLTPQTKELQSTEDERNRCPSQKPKPKRNFLVDSIMTFKEMMNKTYVLLLFASGISIAGINGYLGLVLDICLWKGFSNSQGLFTFVVFNIANIVSRLVPALLKQKKGIDSFIYPIFSTLSGGVGQLLFYFGSSYAIYLVGTCFTGLAVGGVVSSQLILVLKIVRPEHIPVASGLLFTVTGVFTVATGPVFGGVRDQSGSYGIVILTIAVIQALAAIFLTIGLVNRRIDIAKKKDKEATQQRRDTIFSIDVSEL